MRRSVMIAWPKMTTGTGAPGGRSSGMMAVKAMSWTSCSPSARQARVSRPRKTGERMVPCTTSSTSQSDPIARAKSAIAWPALCRWVIDGSGGTASVSAEAIAAWRGGVIVMVVKLQADRRSPRPRRPRKSLVAARTRSMRTASSSATGSTRLAPSPSATGASVSMRWPAGISATGPVPSAARRPCLTAMA